MTDSLDASAPGRRSIPPVAHGPESLPPRHPDNSRLFWAMIFAWIIASVPIAAHWITAENEGRAATASASEDADRSFVRAESKVSGVFVPEGAVMLIDGKPSVVVAERDLRLLVATPVELGRTEGHARQILGGVAAGQYVVADGTSAHRRVAMH
jgi:hypothetical protein